jgi:two-component system sensor histidine kinase RpfC
MKSQGNATGAAEPGAQGRAVRDGGMRAEAPLENTAVKLAFWRAHAARLRAAWRALPEGERGDYTMSFNRLMAALLALAAVALFGNRAQFQYWAPSIFAWIGCGLALFAYLRFRPGSRTLRRSLAILIDVSGTTTLMTAVGEAGAFLYVTYLWIIIGNGVRFGGLYILAATLMSLASFALVIEVNPFWATHVTLSLGLLFGMAVLPGYLYALVSQLAEARRQAVRADRAKSLFLASVSHELRTPLTAIMGMAELLRDSSLNAAQAEMVTTISSAAEGQLSLVQDVLQFSRIEAGHGRMAAAPFDLIELLRGVRAVIAVGARKKGLLINTYITARTPLGLVGDQRHLREVLLNLAGNAIKFTASGSVTLAADGVEMADGTVRLRLEVMDTGIGIATEAQAMIFELFTQAHDGILNRFGGTGLGLALCERQVRMMGGEIGVHSVPNAGSAFWVSLNLKRDDVTTPAPPPANMVASSPDAGWMHAIQQRLGPPADAGAPGVCVAFVQEGNWGVHLPNADIFIQVVEDRVCELPARAVRERFVTTVSQYGSIEELQNAVRIAASLAPSAATARHGMAERPPAATARRLSGLRVLVADDNSINRSIVAKMLEASDARIIFASNGEQALEIMTSGRVDVALLDVNMPVMDGIEAAQLYDISVLGGHRIPLIALTAAAGPDIRERCLAAGMAECLVKPIRMADLIEAIRAIVNRETACLPNPGSASSPAGDAAAAPLLDPQTLLDLKRLGGAEFVEQLVAEFSQDGLRVMDDMEADTMLRDVHGFRAAAHAMRSIAANIGAMALRDLCARWEYLSEAELEREGTLHLARLRRIWHDTALAFESHLNQGALPPGMD